MKTFICISCSAVTPISKNTQSKYCSNKCQAKYQNTLKVQNWLEGKEAGWTGKTRQLKNFIRTYLFTTRGTACEECGWDTRHKDGSILTEIDHVDGDAENCQPQNLKILCPNCHSLTDTFRARNKVSKRDRK